MPVLTTYRKSYMRTHYWTPKIQDGWDPPSWKSAWRHFFCRGWSDWDKISETGAEWHVDGGDVVEMETRCRIPIWRTFGRIQWHVIPEPRITLQGPATWWIHCHDSRATCTLQGAVTWRNQCHDRATLQGVKLFHPPYWKSFFAIFYFIFGFLMEFRLWRAAAFVSFPIHLLLLWISLFTSEQRSKQWKNNK